MNKAKIMTVLLSMLVFCGVVALTESHRDTGAEARVGNTEIVKYDWTAPLDVQESAKIQVPEILIVAKPEPKEFGATRQRGLASPKKMPNPLKAQPMTHTQASVPLHWLNTKQAGEALNFRFGTQDHEAESPKIRDSRDSRDE